MEIPEEVILEKDTRMEGGILRIDRIWIFQIKGGTRNGDFKIVVSENGDGKEGGGIFGDLLDIYAKEKDKRGSYYPTMGYDKVREGDIYYLTFQELDELYSRYLKEVQGRQEVSSSASIARAENMAKAREARATRQKHLKNHFR